MGNNSPFDLNEQGIDSEELKDESAIGEAWLEVVSPLPAIEGGKLEDDTNRRNLAIVGIGILIAVSILLGRLFTLQVVSGQKYSDMAEGNRVGEQRIYAQRGIIYDRNGKPLVKNTASFQVTVTPYLLPDSKEERGDLYADVSEVINVSAGEIKEKAESKGLSHSQPIVVKSKMNYQESLLFEQELVNPSGFLLDEVPIREYVDAGLSHVLGYTARASSSDLENNNYLELNDFVGKSGIEAQYDEEIRGVNGSKRTEVNSFGHPLRTLAKKSPESGNDIHLTIDLDVQKALYEAVRNSMNENNSPKGSAVAINPKTGEVLALVSEPSYDNNLFSGGIDAKIYKDLINDKNQPLFNKAVSATYPTGSTIKPIVAVGGLEEGLISPDTTYVDRGSISIGGGVTFTNFESRSWGRIDVKRALAISSNVFFMAVGAGHGNISGLGIDRLTNWYKNFGLGSRTGVDLPSETTGLVPTPEWKEKVLGVPWYGGETYVLSIGQGDLGVSPIQLAVAHSALANNGELLTPSLLKEIKNEKETLKSFQKESNGKVNFSDKTFRTVREGMERVVSEGTMSGVGLQDLKVAVAGKSGTAETGDDREPHALAVGYGPVNNPEILVSVVIEEGQLSSRSSTPVVRDLFTEYFGVREE